ncbi:hypothetical protein [Horticoccus sp. 23ND18S-11]|uniref:hypothetical protein n=1 Tax=Horticoccus sp. 23ND18S-11 TaxID=3391832 RepID=UPI0039C93CA2
MHAFSAFVAGGLLVSGALIAQTPAAKSAATAPVTRPSVTAGIVSAKVERVARDRATLTVAAKLDVAPQLKLFDAVGKEVAVMRTPDGGLKADVNPAHAYVLAPPPPPRRALPREGLQLPARYVTFGATGGANLGGLFIRPAVVPLTWSEPAKAYATELVVGYEFEDGREAALPAPKTVTFFAEGANARVQADTVTINRSGGSGYQRVTLTTGQIEGETHFTARVSAMDELKASVAIQREPGALALSLPSRELPAFGIGSGELTVSVLARDGMPLVVAKPITVSLSSRRLRQPATVVIEAGKATAVSEFRTAGIGADEIGAQSGALRATLPVALVFPVAAVVAAAVGGALGGAARYLRNKGRRGSLLVRRVVEGMLVGVILVGAAWAGLVGVDLSTGILGTPFGAFVLAALSGYLGCVVLDRVANKTLGSAKAE